MCRKPIPEHPGLATSLVMECAWLRALEEVARDTRYSVETNADHGQRIAEDLTEREGGGDSRRSGNQIVK